jgi:hypothetical protein
MFTSFQTVFFHILCRLMFSVRATLTENVNNVQQRRNCNALFFSDLETMNSIHNTQHRKTSLSLYFVACKSTAANFLKIVHFIRTSSFMGPSLRFLYEPFLRKLTTFIPVCIKSYIKVKLFLYLTN